MLWTAVRAARGTACVAVLVAVAGPLANAQQRAGEAAPLEAQVLSGAYELSNEAGSRKCVLLLRPSAAPGGFAAGFPAQCRAALPVLGKVAAWHVETLQRPPHARFMLRNAAGGVELDFDAEGPEGAARARDAAGQIYILRPTTGASLAKRVDSLVGARPAPRVVFNPPPPDPVAMGRASGAYALIRGGERDTGCRITLEAASPSATDGEARMTQKCDDKGVAYFGPRKWNIAGETLWLIGTRGRLGFDRNRKGGWDKSPGQGEYLGLVRH